MAGTFQKAENVQSLLNFICCKYFHDCCISFFKQYILLDMTKIKPSGLVSFFFHLILQLTKMSQEGNMHKKMLVLFLKPVIASSHS